jgi:acyl carrier protein
MAVDAWPLSANGKVNRAALALPEEDPPAAAAQAPPEGPTEENVAALAEELFGRQGLGRHDDFFELGADSLVAVRLILRLRQAFTIDLPMGAFYDAPTIAGLAALVDAASDGESP